MAYLKTLTFAPCRPVLRQPPKINGNYKHLTLCSLKDVNLSPKEQLKPSWFNQPPLPVKIVRQPLDQPFAVLMMRSGYNAVDELDFVAMDDFQVCFFEIRSREWQDFLPANQGVRQGIITEPRYFDFISYAQMLTIQYLLRSPRVVFEEKYEIKPVDDEAKASYGTRVVKRDLDRYPTPTSLLNAWATIVGDSICDYILANNNQLPAPQLLSASANLTDEQKQFLFSGIQQIYDYFLSGGYCLSVYYTNDRSRQPSKLIARVELVAPCILWGNQALTKKNGIPNDYDCMCINAFARRCGLSLEYSTTYSSNSIFRDWKLL